MKITLRTESSLALEDDGGPMTVDAPSEQLQYSPFHMMGSALAYCTYSVLQSWAGHASIPADGLRLSVSWHFADSPHRIAGFDVHIEWPNLPESRRRAASRAATLCAVHATLMHPPTIHVNTDS